MVNVQNVILFLKYLKQIYLTSDLMFISIFKYTKYV